MRTNILKAGWPDSKKKKERKKESKSSESTDNKEQTGILSLGGLAKSKFVRRREDPEIRIRDLLEPAT